MTTTKFKVEKVRQDFPCLQQNINGKPLVYLDSAASAQRPTQVIKAVQDYDMRDHANVHRGVHTLSQRATQAYEQARAKVCAYLNASSEREIIFVRGTSEAINLVASSFGRSNLVTGDEVLITVMEHHANIIPWQMTCAQTGAQLVVVDINDRGELDLDDYRSKLSSRTRVVAFGHISNTLGSINPVDEMIKLAQQAGAITVVDGAQAILHTRVDVQALDCDYYAFSGHKIYGPTGIGVLYGKEAGLDLLPPYQGGGDMIKKVTFEHTTYADLPAKFEAGTPNISGAVGLGAAIDYIEQIGLKSIAAHELELLNYATQAAQQIKPLKLIGTAKNKASILSFVIDGIHPHDLGTILDSEGVAVRTGHHCTQPLMQRLNVPATTRASFAMYNTQEEIDVLFKAIMKAITLFS